MLPAEKPTVCFVVVMSQHVDTDKDVCSVGTWGCNVKEEPEIICKPSAGKNT